MCVYTVYVRYSIYIEREFCLFCGAGEDLSGKPDEFSWGFSVYWDVDGSFSTCISFTWKYVFVWLYEYYISAHVCVQ